MAGAPGWELPLALTSINASSWLWSLFEQGALDRCLLARGASLDSYHDLFAELVVGFAAEWARQAPESIMAFETVAAAFVAQVRASLERGGTNLCEGTEC